MTSCRHAVTPSTAASAVLAALALATVAGCSGGSDGTTTPTATATTTATVTSAAPPTGSGVPASPTTSGSGAGSGTGSSGGTGGGPGLCTPTVMTFTLGGSSGAAGTSYFSVIATNASQQPCVTTGYPGVALLDGSGNQVVQATRDQSTPVQTLTVQPGEKVAAVIGVSDVPQGGAGSCPTSPAFLFTLPDNTDSTTLTQRNPACGATVQPFTRYTGS